MLTAENAGYLARGGGSRPSAGMIEAAEEEQGYWEGGRGKGRLGEGGEGEAGMMTVEVWLSSSRGGEKL